MLQIKSIDDVIASLDNIIVDAEKNNDTSGYFAALYRKVTIKVKEGIANNEFDDGPRMEKLDVIFASRYLDAYHDWKTNKPVTESWKKAFDISSNYRPIVLQHLLMGMNAHINLDLGIAAAEVCKNKNINGLQNDFNKINAVLSALVIEVQNGLAAVWPRLKWILQKTKGVDDFLIDYSMKLSRDGAWKFAVSLANTPDENINSSIAARDLSVAKKAELVTNPGFISSLIFGIIRIGEKGSVKQKIDNLK